MTTLTLLFILPALTFFALLLSGFLLRKQWLPLRAAVAGLLVLAGGVFLQARHDYGWATSILQGLSDDAIIIQETRSGMLQHPWTVLYPPLTALAVIDNVDEVLELDGELWLEFDLLNFQLDQGDEPRVRQFMLNCTRFDRVTRQTGGLLIESLPEDNDMLQLLCPTD